MARLRYQHIIWDWNGTLIDDLELTLSLVNAELSYLGINSIDLVHHRTHLEFPISSYYQKLGVDLQQRPLDKISEAFHLAYKERFHTCSLHNSARELLSELSCYGVKQHILSSYDQDNLIKLTKHYVVHDFFDNIIGLPDKPGSSKVALGRLLIEKLKPSAVNQVILVGDTLHDAEVASEIGCDCVLVSHGHNSREVLNRAGRPVIDNFAELARYIKELGDAG